MYLDEELFIDFLSEKEILWLGINFGKSKLTKSGFSISQEEMHRLFHEWNQLILTDQKKYDIRMSFRKPVMQYNLSAITKINRSQKLGNVLTKRIDIKDVLDEEQIVEYVSGIEFPGNCEYALTFIVESFDSATKTASIWVVILKSDTKKVALCEKFLKVPSGFGTRNYWARTFYNVFYDVQTSAFLRWSNMVADRMNGGEENSESA
ncbi:MAG: hypothetical protein SPL47_08320 [Bacteroidales bacterium]|nr:hypothetical protein [Bacteroidales bacterium]